MMRRKIDQVADRVTKLEAWQNSEGLKLALQEAFKPVYDDFKEIKKKTKALEKQVTKLEKAVTKLEKSVKTLRKKK